ncbi:hypothetical protein LXA43DRAFT_1103460 [Ganoderma leucocontextum]|nr:hypothetical protein LXA43DRAFT_1103460 [Ganoderma leucocontextum]
MAALPGSRPSDHWLQHPAWIDGARNPPHFYITLAEINADRMAAGYPPLPPQQAPPAPMAPPAPAPGIPPAAGPPNTVGAEGNVDEVDAGQPVMTGHHTSVVVTYTEIVMVAGTSRPSTRKTKDKTKEKTAQSVKSDHIVLEGCSRVDFLDAALAVHDLATQYRAGQQSGPAVKMWWTGASGGKGAASIIESDHDFEVAKTAILKKNKDKCTIFIEFDLDSMDGFQIKKRPIAAVSGPGNGDDKVRNSEKVPRMDTFDDATQLHGHIILQLKAQWPCDKHHGEHGEQGFCYIDPNGNHIGLNMRKFKVWAAAIAAYEATKYTRPNPPDDPRVRILWVQVTRIAGSLRVRVPARPARLGV